MLISAIKHIIPFQLHRMKRTGLIGNPYRGAKSGGVTGLAKGVASGTTGLFVAPFVGALGFIAKTTDGIGSTTKYLDLGVIEARCRPAR